MRALKKFLLLTIALTVALPYEASASEFNAAKTIDKFNGAESGGIQIYDNADLTFDGGVIWDYAGYRTGGEGSSPTVSVGRYANTSLTGNESITSDFEIEGGKFRGAIKMYKGLDVDTVEFLPKDAEKKQEAEVISAGNFRISGGTFDFTKNSELLMKKSAEGSFSLTGGTYNVYDKVGVTIGSDNRLEKTGEYKQDLSVSGGTYKVDGTLKLQGQNITFDGKTIVLSGKGTLSFDGATTISSQISWDTGKLRLADGSMDLKADVSVNEFIFGAAGALTIEKDSTLTVTSDFVMAGNSSLSGKGTLNLQGGAKATFKKLSDFGTIIAHKGELTFAALSSVDNITIDKGTLNINGQVTVGTLVLENQAVANITQELIVSSLNFDRGTINFAKEDSKLTLSADSTITNDASFTFAEGVRGTLQFTGGTLNFNDKQGVPKKFENDRLSLIVKEGTTVNFNQERDVTLDELSASQATLNFNKGNSSFSSAQIGHANESRKTAVNIADGVSVSVGQISAALGSEFNIAEKGTLILNRGEVLGNTATASTFKGKGTLKVTGTLTTFNGKFDNFGTLQIGGTKQNVQVTYGGLFDDAVLNKLQFSGTNEAKIILEKGVLKVKTLKFDDNSKGVIDIAAGGTLALDASGKDDVTDIISGTGSIGGDGTLQLVDNTSVNFGGNNLINRLGTLEIGTGTATISGNIGIGAIKFGTTEGGTLSIAAGKTLNLQEITTAGKNVVTGGGTLTLTKASTFGGQVNELGALDFSGNVIFDYGQTSSIGTVKGTNADLIINNGDLTVTNGLTLTGGNLTVSGTLNVANGLTVNNGTVSGGGVLSLANGGTFTADGALKLTTGGTVYLTDASAVKDWTALKNAKINIAKTLTVSGTLSTENGAAFTGDTLILAGTGTFAANAVQTNALSLSNGAKATFAGNNALKKLDLAANSVVSINGGATLTLAQDTVGAAQSVFTGAGTLALNKSGLQMESRLSDLGKLIVSKSASLNGTANVGTLEIADGATLTQNAAMTAGNVSFGANSGLTLNDTLTVTRNIDVGSNKLSGSGTLNLAGGANGTFATGNSFQNGHLIVGSGTAKFTGNTTMGAVGFSGNGGTLSITENNTLTLEKITTANNNTVTGAGTLRLTGTGSVFGASIASLGELNVAGGGANFTASANVDKVSFSGGTLTIGSGAILTVSELTQSGGTFGTISGAGAFRIGVGKADFTTGGNSIGGLYIGTGVLNVKSNSKAERVSFDSADGTLNVDGSTLTVSDALIAAGTVNGANGTLMLENGGQFKKVLSDFGTIKTNTGALTFYEDATVKNVYVGDGSAYFRKGASITNALTVGAGKVTFNQNASIANGASIGGTLDIGSTHLTVSGGLTFADNSALHLRLAAKATDDTGKIVDSNLFGQIIVNSGTVTIGNNVNLDMTIDYGLHTASDGTEFKLISGTVDSGSFTFANSRYKLEEVTCSSGSGLCYKLKETSNAEEIVEDEKGSKNNQNTAAAVLDGGLFDESDKMFAVASHLDALSQKKGGGRAYLNALTALAPDVSGAITGQSVATQTRVARSAFNRLSGLQRKMGNRSEKYRQMRELYGRSGGSAYNSSLMRSADYYKKAGYTGVPERRAYPSYEAQGRITPREYDYDSHTGKTYPTYEIKGGMPRDYNPYDDMDAKPKRKVAKYRSQRQADYGAFYGARPAVGVWAQALYNTNEYKSASDEDGFSADSTGLAMGFDVIFADVTAIGFGYARTTSDVKALQRSTDVTGDTFFLYGMYKPANWYLSGMVSSGKNTFDESKDLSGLTVADSFDTKTTGGQLMLGFDRQGWNPAFGLRYLSVSRAAHEDSVGQKIASFSNTVFSAVAETQKTFELSRAGKGVWSSDLSAGLVYDFSRSADEAVVSLTNGASYTVEGKDMDPYGMELGAAISYVWGKSVDLSARYNLDVRPDWFSHSLTATLRVTF